MDSPRTKAEWRRHILAQRSPEQALQLAAAICKHAELAIEALNPKLVASFHPMVGEPDLSHLNLKLEKKNQLVLPEINGHSLIWRRPGELVGGPFGTKSPTGESIEVHNIDVMLIPAVGIDSDGYRLGRGGGFYDRVFSVEATSEAGLADRPIRLAVVFQDEVVPHLPHLPHDIRVHGVVTDVGVTWFV